MTDEIKIVRRHPHTIILEGFAEIEKLKSVQIKYAKKKERFNQLLENDENVTEIDTKYFREVVGLMDDLFATLPLMIDNYDEAIKVIDINKQRMMEMSDEINELSAKEKKLKKKILEIEEKVYSKIEESRRLSDIITYKIDAMNNLYLDEAEQPGEDDYKKLTKEMRENIIEEITKDLPKKLFPYNHAVTKYPHIPKAYIYALYNLMFNKVLQDLKKVNAITKEKTNNE